ncbi:MAG: RluA family pseudouridine synthase [Blastocatellia bacterium]
MKNDSWQINAAEVGVRLDKWLADAARLGSRAKAFEAITHGKIFVNNTEQTAQEAGRKLQIGETVRIWMDRPGSAKHRVFTKRQVGGLDILYEDEALLVINKPSGVLTVALPKHPEESTLYDQVADYVRHRNKLKPQVVHRIDRDTSGLVVFAKTDAARNHLKKQFALRQPERIYQALVYGIPFPEKGVWRDFLVWDEAELVQKLSDARDRRAVEAKCNYRVLEKFREASLLEIKLVTGKQNQIRLQAVAHGHQLVGEKQYVAEPPHISIPFARQALHAWKLQLQQPLSQKPLQFEAPLPEDFAALVKRLRNS